MTEQQIRSEVSDRVLTITLDRPDKLNAFTHQMAAELIGAFDRADADDDVRVVIVTGAGRGFCAGADLSGGNRFDRGAGMTEAPRDEGGKVALRIYRSRKPVIAAINGPAVGVGITMTLPMDIRLASTTARIGFVFTRRGIVPEAASSWFLPRLVGISRAAEWVFTGRVFDAAEARDAGLVLSVHAPDALLPAAEAIAREIVEHTSPVAVATARRLMWRMLGADSPARAHVADSRAMVALGGAADAHEGVAAFLDKRPARFPGLVTRDLPEVFADPQPSWADTLD